MNFKYKVLIASLLVVLITSLHPRTMYFIVLYSAITWLIIPINKYWDKCSLNLMLFSIFYPLIIIIGDGDTNLLNIIAYALAPTAFYRSGRYFMSRILDDRGKLYFILFLAFSLLLPLFLITIQDIAMVGLINNSRSMYIASRPDQALAATLYGLLASFGIGSSSIVYVKDVPLKLKIFYLILTLLSMLVVIHLVNRTGIVILLACLIFTFIFSTKINIGKMLSVLIPLIPIFLLLINLDFADLGISDAYAAREETSGYEASSAGGRVELWQAAIANLIVSPMGWKRIEYSHNLWLDIAAVGGWIAFILFVVATCVYLKRMKNAIRFYRNPVIIVLVGFNIALFLSCMVEPIIEGSYCFFSLFLLIWGVSTESISALKNKY